MTSGRPETSSHRLALLVAALLLWCNLPMLTGAPAMILKGFQTRGMDEAGRKSWDMTGGRARVTGSMHKLEQIVLRLFLENGEQAVIRSPACDYNRASGLVESNSSLVLRSNQMILNGIGYDILTSERKLRVRSNVHMRVKVKTGTAALDLSSGERKTKESDGK